MWAENSLFVIGKSIAGHGSMSPERLAEAVEGAEALLAVCKELQRRVQNDGF